MILLTDEQFQTVCAEAYKAFQAAVPNPKTRYVAYYTNAYGNRQRGSTGNMAFNASKLEFTTPDIAKIYVDKRIAPYVPYTNEPWVAAKWKGHKNPNEGWFKRAAEIVALSIARSINGEIVKK